jgi:hypothetical protein
MKLVTRRVFLATAAVSVIAASCAKKSESKEESVSENVTKPVGALNLVIGSMQSAGAGMSSTAALVADDGLTEADCDEHAEPKARAGDQADDSGRLMRSENRYALNHMYCMATKNTGAPDSFVGALSIVKDLMCVFGESAVFDGTTRETVATKASFATCLADMPAAARDEVLAGLPDSGVPMTVTAGLGAQNPVNANAGWDGGMKVALEFMGEKMDFSVQVKDSDNIVSVGVLSGRGSASTPVDAYIATVNKTTGTIRYEAVFQRIRTATGQNSSDGWNRHARMLINGTVDDDFKFTNVTGVAGAYSDISINGQSNGSSPTAPLSNGFMWTVKGTEAAGYASRYYSLNTPSAPNAVASWGSTVSACNGKSTSVETCTGSALELSADADTGFALDMNNSAFVKSEDWFNSAKPLSFDSVTFSVTP